MTISDNYFYTELDFRVSEEVIEEFNSLILSDSDVKSVIYGKYYFFYETEQCSMFYRFLSDKAKNLVYKLVPSYLIEYVDMSLAFALSMPDCGIMPWHIDSTNKHIKRNITCNIRLDNIADSNNRITCFTNNVDPNNDYEVNIEALYYKSGVPYIFNANVFHAVYNFSETPSMLVSYGFKYDMSYEGIYNIIRDNSHD